MDAENPHMLSDYMSRHTDVSTSNFIHIQPSTTDTGNGTRHFRRRAVHDKERLLKYAQDPPVTGHHGYGAER